MFTVLEIKKMCEKKNNKKYYKNYIKNIAMKAPQIKQMNKALDILQRNFNFKELEKFNIKVRALKENYESFEEKHIEGNNVFSNLSSVINDVNRYRLVSLEQEVKEEYNNLLMFVNGVDAFKTIIPNKKLPFSIRKRIVSFLNYADTIYDKVKESIEESEQVINNIEESNHSK